ncbi:MAG: sodium:proton antiporter [Desulfurococcaceae archaeon]
MLEEYTFILMICILAVNALLSIYGVVYRPSLVKKLISLTILSDTIFISIIFVGYIFKYPLVPPVYSEYSEESAMFLSTHASDPLPQALVLTGIVIGLAVNALIAFGIIQVYRLTNTTDARRAIRSLLEEGGE